MAERRRLPVIQNAQKSAPEPEQADDENEPRPPWHWVGFGTVAILAVWLLLSYAAGAVAARVMAARFGADASEEQIRVAMAAMDASERTRLMATIALPNVLALALAAFAGGVIIGRFGTGTGAKEGARSGGVVAAIVTIVAWRGINMASVVTFVVILAVAMGFAAWGARLGASRRPAA
jgi:hypothetical protein